MRRNLVLLQTGSGFFPPTLKVIVQKVEVEVEVESQRMLQQRQALESYSKAVEEQRNRLGQVNKRASIISSIIAHLCFLCHAVLSPPSPSLFTHASCL